MLSVSSFYNDYSEGRNAELNYAECCHAESCILIVMMCPYAAFYCDYNTCSNA